MCQLIQTEKTLRTIFESTWILGVSTKANRTHASWVVRSPSQASKRVHNYFFQAEKLRAITRIYCCLSTPAKKKRKYLLVSKCHKDFPIWWYLFNNFSHLRNPSKAKTFSATIIFDLSLNNLKISIWCASTKKWRAIQQMKVVVHPNLSLNQSVKSLLAMVRSLKM